MAKKEEKKAGSYNPELDVVVHDFGLVVGTDLHAQIKSYNGGEKKLSVHKKVGSKGKTAQVFRISVEDALPLAAFITEMEGELVALVDTKDE